MVKNLKKIVYEKIGIFDGVDIFDEFREVCDIWIDWLIEIVYIIVNENKIILYIYIY